MLLFDVVYITLFAAVTLQELHTLSYINRLQGKLVM